MINKGWENTCNLRHGELSVPLVCKDNYPPVGCHHPLSVTLIMMNTVV